MTPFISFFGENDTRRYQGAQLRDAIVDSDKSNRNRNKLRRRNDDSTNSKTLNVPVVMGVPDIISSHESSGEEIDVDEDDLMETGSNMTEFLYHHRGSRPFRRSSFSKRNTANALRQGRQKQILMFLIVVLGAAASAAFMYIGIVGAREEMQKAFRTDAMDLTHAIQAAWHDYEMMALWIHESCHLLVPHETHNASSSSQDHKDVNNFADHAVYCSRDKFQHVYEYIDSVGLDFIAVQYIPNVTHNDRVYVEEEARQFYATKSPNMTYGGIKALELSEDGSVLSLGPSPPKPWYFPVHHLLPLELNEAAVDIDIYSYRKQEIDAAFQTMKPFMSDRVRLLREQDPRVFGIEFIHPGVVTSDAQRTHPGLQHSGLSKLVIRIPSLINMAEAAFMKDCRLYLFDVTNEAEEPVFLVAADLVGDQTQLHHECFYEDIDLDKPKTFQETITIMNKKWRVVVQTLDHGTKYEEQLVHIIVGGGLMFVACIIIVIWFHTHMVRLTRENHIVSQAQAEKSALAMKQVKRERHLNDFIAHEVRNPLSSAMAALSFVLSIAKERVTDPEVREALLEDIGIVDGSLDYINDLLKNMLDIHKSACNEMKLDIAPTNILHDVFEPVSKILVPRCGTIDIILDCNPPELCANIDRLRMKQVILNLTINATKFVDKGFIRLRAEVMDGSTCIFVEDSGPGIPEQKRARLFEKFQESLDLRNQGTGIGLNVCKNLTKLMGGIIYLDQTYSSGIPGCPGAGFIIDLQQEPTFQVPPPFSAKKGPEKQGSSNQSATVTTVDSYSLSSQHDTPLTNGKAVDDLEACEDSNTGSNHHQYEAALPEELSILFVDDDAVLRKLFARSVARVVPHWNIQQASYGEEALQLVGEVNYDIIFMDQYMAANEKMLLGTETVAILRNEKKVPSLICGLSANDLGEQFMEAGANAFMIKPFPCEKNALERELIRVWGCKNA